MIDCTIRTIESPDSWPRIHCFKERTAICDSCGAIIRNVGMTSDEFHDFVRSQGWKVGDKFSVHCPNCKPLRVQRISLESKQIPKMHKVTCHVCGCQVRKKMNLKAFERELRSQGWTVSTRRAMCPRHSGKVVE